MSIPPRKVPKFHQFPMWIIRERRTHAPRMDDWGIFPNLPVYEMMNRQKYSLIQVNDARNSLNFTSRIGISFEPTKVSRVWRREHFSNLQPKDDRKKPIKDGPQEYCNVTNHSHATHQYRSTFLKGRTWSSSYSMQGKGNNSRLVYRSEFSVTNNSTALSLHKWESECEVLLLRYSNRPNFPNYLV